MGRRLGLGIIRRGKENYIQMKFGSQRIEFHTYPVLVSIDKIVGYENGEVLTLCTFSNYDEPVEEGFSLLDYLYDLEYKHVDEIIASVEEVYLLPEEQRVDFNASLPEDYIVVYLRDIVCEGDMMEIEIWNKSDSCIAYKGVYDLDSLQRMFAVK